jgi:hypothetical protein
VCICDARIVLRSATHRDFTSHFVSNVGAFRLVRSLFVVKISFHFNYSHMLVLLLQVSLVAFGAGGVSLRSPISPFFGL